MKQLKLLLIEDNPDDALLLLREFKKADYQLEHRCIASVGELVMALESKDWDVVVSDFNMPQFNGLEALYLVNSCEQELPFIICSGAIGEEVAVEAMRAGASDFVTKEKLGRLVPAVERALREAQNRLQRQRAEQELEEMRLRMEGIIASAMDAIITVNEQQQIVLFNRAAERLFGYSSQEVLNKHMQFLLPARYQQQHSGHMKAFGNTGQSSRNLNVGDRTVYGLRRSGQEFPIEASISQVEVNGQKFFTIIIRDITERMASLQKLAEEKQRLELALQGGKLGMWDWDVSSGKIIINGYWADIMGYAPDKVDQTLEEVLGKVHRDDILALRNKIEDYISRPSGYFQHEYRIMSLTGHWRWILTSGKALRCAEDGHALRILGTHQDTTEKKIAALQIRNMELEVLNLKITQQRNQSTAFLSGQEDERRRLARELHDGIGQQLNALKIQLSLEQATAAARKAIDYIIEEIIRINNKLMPLVLEDFGLEAGIRQLVARFKEVSSIDIYYYCDLKGERFAADLEIAIFRIIQEATSNALKYANASNISVQLIRQEEELLVMIEDDGIGFMPGEKEEKLQQGFGLLNMQYRVEALKGKLFIESSPGHGCLVNAVLPIKKL